MMTATRTLTRSGLALPELGLGCATLAFDASPDALQGARQMLGDALDADITYFDTAPFYGRGLSERVVGDALRGKDVVVSSKVGRLLRPDATASTHMPFRVEYDYSHDGVLRSVEDSLQRLGLDKIDILYVHDLGIHTHKENAAARLAEFCDEGGYRALDRLRADGTVSAIGLGVNEVKVCEQVMEYGTFDVFLLAGRHTLLERNGSRDFFDTCSKAGTDIVIGGPFNSGLLVGGQTYNYGSVPDDIVVKHQQLVAYCKAHQVDIGAAALQFPLRESVVKSVIPGPKTPQELKQILSWMTQDIPGWFWDGLIDLDKP